MPLLVRNVRLALDEPEELLLERVAARLRLPPSAILAHAPVRRSLDCRRHDDIHFVYHVEVALAEKPAQEKSLLRRLGPAQVVLLSADAPEEPTPGTEPLPERPTIVGFGPAGIFAALRLARFGYRPIVLERGVDVRRRHRDVMQTFYRDHLFNPQSNLLFGEGGAGTYSDGKLYTRVGDPLVRTVLEEFYRFGADPAILTEAHPHIGSDRLPTICRNIRRHLDSCGGETRFEAQLLDLDINDGIVKRANVAGQWQPIGPLILAVGHSARDTLRMLHQRGVVLESRPFQIGVRVEHPQSLIDRWQYGRHGGHDRLPPAEYFVVAKGAAGTSGDCFSFCMCPGGMILPTHEEPGLIATNGASRSKRDSPWGNSGLVVTVRAPGDDSDPLAGVEWQRSWEQKAYAATGGTYAVPAQRADDYVAHRPSDGALSTSFPLGGRWTDVRLMLPDFVGQAVANALAILDRKMPGYAGPDALVTAPETRASSPVRLPRDPRTRAAVGFDNLYPAGEGAGYAGGIVSAAIDGLKTADALIRRYAPPT